MAPKRNYTDQEIKEVHVWWNLNGKNEPPEIGTIRWTRAFNKMIKTKSSGNPVEAGAPEDKTEEKEVVKQSLKPRPIVYIMESWHKSDTHHVGSTTDVDETLLQNNTCLKFNEIIQLRKKSAKDEDFNEKKVLWMINRHGPFQLVFYISGLDGTSWNGIETTLKDMGSEEEFKGTKGRIMAIMHMLNNQDLYWDENHEYQVSALDYTIHCAKKYSSLISKEVKNLPNVHFKLLDQKYSTQTDEIKNKMERRKEVEQQKDNRIEMKKKISTAPTDEEKDDIRQSYYGLVGHQSNEFFPSTRKDKAAWCRISGTEPEPIVKVVKKPREQKEEVKAVNESELLAIVEQEVQRIKEQAANNNLTLDANAEPAQDIVAPPAPAKKKGKGGRKPKTVIGKRTEPEVSALSSGIMAQIEQVQNANSPIKVYEAIDPSNFFGQEKSDDFQITVHEPKAAQAEVAPVKAKRAYKKRVTKEQKKLLEAVHAPEQAAPVQAPKTAKQINSQKSCKSARSNGSNFSRQSFYLAQKIQKKMQNKAQAPKISQVSSKTAATTATSISATVTPQKGADVHKKRSTSRGRKIIAASSTIDPPKQCAGLKTNSFTKK